MSVAEGESIEDPRSLAFGARSRDESSLQTCLTMRVVLGGRKEKVLRTRVGVVKDPHHLVLGARERGVRVPGPGRRVCRAVSCLKAGRALIAREATVRLGTITASNLGRG